MSSVSCNSTSDSPEWTPVAQQPLQPSDIISNRIGGIGVRSSNDISITPTDLWSAAFREAIETLEPRIDVAEFAGKTIEQLFHDLDAIDKSAGERSIFRRGLAHLRSAKGPLENFKLALDLANPFISFEPAAVTVVGVVRGVTTVRRSTSSLVFSQQTLERTGSADMSTIDRYQSCKRRSRICKDHRGHAGTDILYR